MACPGEPDVKLTKIFVTPIGACLGECHPELIIHFTNFLARQGENPVGIGVSAFVRVQGVPWHFIESETLDVGHYGGIEGQSLSLVDGHHLNNVRPGGIGRFLCRYELNKLVNVPTAGLVELPRQVEELFRPPLRKGIHVRFVDEAEPVENHRLETPPIDIALYAT